VRHNCGYAEVGAAQGNDCIGPPTVQRIPACLSRSPPIVLWEMTDVVPSPREQLRCSLALDAPRVGAGTRRSGEWSEATLRRVGLPLHLHQLKNQASVARVDAGPVALLQVVKAKAVPAALIGPPEAGPA